MNKKILTIIGGILIGLTALFQLAVSPEPPVGATIPIVVANFETSLQSSITSTATSMTLVSGTDTAGNNLSGYNCFTIDEGTSIEEHVCGTASGTAITSMIRGIDPIDGNLEVTALKKAHRRAASIKATNFPILGIIARVLNGNETLPALIQYATTVGDPTDDDHLARKAYVDSQATGTSTVDRVIVTATAGETIAVKQIVYFDATDNEWKLADASSAATADNVAFGIARGSGTNGNAITNGVLLFGLDGNQSGMTAGDTMFLSDTAGAISSSAGTIEVVIGIARNSTDLYFLPRFDKIMTKDQADALAGDSGTPSTTNLFITELGFQRAIEVYATTSTGNDTYVITLDPVPAAYVAGMTVRVTTDVANTGAATINVNSLGAKSITKNGAVALVTNDIRASHAITLVYDGTQFQLQGSAVVLSKANADTLVAGTSSDADALHTHDGLTRAKQYAFINTDIAVGTSEETLLSFTLNANDLGTNGMLRITIAGIANNGTNGFLINLDWGASAAQLAWTKTGGSSGAEPFTYVMEIVNRNSASAQHLQGTILGWNGESALNVFQNTATEDTTSNVTVVVRGHSIQASALSIDRITVELLGE